MLYTQIKNYIEIATILKNNEITTTDFIHLFELSKYEYDNDMNLLKEMQTSYGIEILINEKKAIIYYKVINQELFRQIYPIFNELYFRYHNNKIASKKFMIDCIVAWILIDAKAPIPSTLISEHLGYSRSGLREPLRWARIFLEHYNLEYINIPHYGLKVNGNEFYKRLALISLNNFIDPRIIIDLDQNLIYNNENSVFSNLKQQIIQELSSLNAFSISTINSKLLSLYLTVQYNRIKRNYIITDSIEYEKEIYKTFEYHYSSKLLDKLYPNYHLPENEVLYLALMLIIINESESHNQYFQFMSLFKNESQMILTDICELLRNKVGIIINEPIYISALEKAVNHIVLKHHFKMATLKGFSLSGKSFAAVKKPLLLMIRGQILDLLITKYHIHAQKSNMIELIDVIQRCIQAKPIYFPKMHLCILTHLSVIDSLLLKESIHKKYLNLFFDDIEIKNNQNDIDIYSEDTIYITNYLSNAKIGKNVYILDNNHNDIVNLPHFLLMNNQLSKAHIQSIQAYTYTRNIKDEVISDLFIKMQNYQSIERDNIRFLINTHHVGKANIRLYSFSKRTSISCLLEVNKIIELEFEPKDNNIRLFDFILTIFMIDPSFFDEMIINPSFSTLDTYLCKLNLF